jgi:hypothetical protein
MNRETKATTEKSSRWFGAAIALVTGFGAGGLQKTYAMTKKIS